VHRLLFDAKIHVKSRYDGLNGIFAKSMHTTPHHTPIILPFEGAVPVIPESVLVCPGAVVMGDVHIGEQSSVWFNAVIRGDVHSIRIGARTNIQDLAMLHVTHKRFSLNIGSNVTVGHSAILHGCTVHDNVLIGMGAKVLDNSLVRSHTIVAAGAVVREGFETPEGVLMAGIPAKVVRDLRADELSRFEESAQAYVSYSERFRASNIFHRS
jgi:carbonic anhydrase/acetyltransferase-like protein (isoleucine patch superfamily)